VVDEVQELCNRVLGTGPAAREACEQALAEAEGCDRTELLAAAIDACRERSGRGEAAPDPPRQASTLSSAVAQELAEASAQLPERHREALVLRELMRLSYEQTGHVLGIERAAVGPLLARARLRLRQARRRSAEGDSRCSERERALRALACRQDSEPLSVAEDAWLLGHLRECTECARAHAAMVEASVCYRTVAGLPSATT